MKHMCELSTSTIDQRFKLNQMKHLLEQQNSCKLPKKLSKHCDSSLRDLDPQAGPPYQLSHAAPFQNGFPNKVVTPDEGGKVKKVM
jgi:hypothetical protein